MSVSTGTGHQGDQVSTRPGTYGVQAQSRTGLARVVGVCGPLKGSTRRFGGPGQGKGEDGGYCALVDAFLGDLPWWALPGCSSRCPGECSLVVQVCAHGCAWVCIRVQAYALMRAHMRPYARSHIRAHAGACGHTGAGMRTCVQGRGPPGVLPPIACTLLKTHPLFKKIPYFRPFFLGWPGSCNINYSYIEYY